MSEDMDSSGPQRRGPVILLPLILAIALAAYKYFSAPTIVDVETGKKLHVALTDSQGDALGLQSFQEVLRTEHVVASGPAVDQVTLVAGRLINVVKASVPNFDWKVSVVESPQANAFCLPGGKIVVYTGILPITQNADALAVVLGHEIAHAVLRHGSQRMLKTEVVNAVVQGASAAVALSDMSEEKRRMVMGAMGISGKFGVLMPFSRENESEADERGLYYAARAGFNPQEAVAFWERMSSSGGGQPPEFMSTHPSHGSRIAHLQKIMPEAKAEYERAAGSVRR